jgi:hypothetical protein
MLKERKCTFQLLEEFAVAYKAPKYTYKTATPELIEAIRAAKEAENREQALRSKAIGIMALMFSIGLFRLLIFLNNHELVTQFLP